MSWCAQSAAARPAATVLAPRRSRRRALPRAAAGTERTVIWHKAQDLRLEDHDGLALVGSGHGALSIKQAALQDSHPRPQSCANTWAVLFVFYNFAIGSFCGIMFIQPFFCSHLLLLLRRRCPSLPGAGAAGCRRRPAGHAAGRRLRPGRAARPQRHGATPCVPRGRRHRCCDGRGTAWSRRPAPAPAHMRRPCRICPTPPATCRRLRHPG